MQKLGIRLLRKFYRTFLERFSFFRRVKARVLTSYYSRVTAHPLPEATPVKTPPKKARLLMPEEYLPTLKKSKESGLVFAEKVRVFGHTRFIMRKNAVLCWIATSSSRFLKAWEDFFIQEELLGLMAFDLRKMTAEKSCEEPVQKLGGKWISLLHPASDNWMHFIAEVLPLLMQLLSQGREEKFGILYDANIHPNALEALSILCEGRTLAPIGKEGAWVEKLLTSSDFVGGWCFAFPRDIHYDPVVSTVPWPHHFDQPGLQLTRQRLLAHFNVSLQKEKLFFLKRPTFIRRMVNEEEVITRLAAAGLKVLEPGSLTLPQQIACFSAARIIVAQAGAALANIMFMPPGSTIICLIADSPWINRTYFAEYARIFGVNVVYCKNPVDDITKYDASKLLDIHHPTNAVFACNIESVLAAIARCDAAPSGIPAVAVSA